MLGTRVLSGFCLIAVLLGVLYLDEWFAPWFPLWLLLAVLAMGATAVELAGLLAAYNSRISPADQPRILRLRAVIHAGEVHRDGNGPFGEDLDVAFRLLDAPRFKKELKSATVPLALVASDYIYQSIIRHGYDGIDGAEFLPLVTVNVGDQRRRGWVHLPSAGRIPVGLPTLPQASLILLTAGYASAAGPATRRRPSGSMIVIRC